MNSNDLDFYLDQGVQFYRSRQYEQASVAFQNALTHAAQKNNKKAIIYANIAIGDCYFYLNNLDGAQSHFEEAHSLSEQLIDKNAFALSLVNLAKVLYLKGGYTAKAGYYLIEAIQIFDEIDDNLGLLYAYSITGDFEASQGNRDIANEYFERASIMAQSLNNKSLSKHFHKKLEK